MKTFNYLNKEYTLVSCFTAGDLKHIKAKFVIVHEYAFEFLVLEYDPFEKELNVMTFVIGNYELKDLSEKQNGLVADTTLTA